jgi:glycerate-2-kinase
MKNRVNDLKKIINLAIKSVNLNSISGSLIRLENSVLSIKDSSYNPNDYKNIYVIGFGKASSYMCYELEKILKNKITDGLILTKYGHTHKNSKIKTLESAHPVPDKQSIENTSALLKFLEKTKKNDLVICLISGGGSALLTLPLPEISIKDISSVTSILLKSGTDITVMNSVRKSLSAVKGGKLLNHIHPAKCVSLIISDVIGDDPATIASGPTVITDINKNNKTAIEILKKNFKNPDKFIKAILQNRFAFNKIIKPDNHILLNNRTAVNSAYSESLKLGYNSLILSTMIEGETKEIAKMHAAIAKEILYNNIPLSKPAAIISGGETTVTIKGNGKGGRNQEFVLSFLNEIKCEKNIIAASIGTDGTDGPTDAAGAFCNYKIYSKSVKENRNIKKFIDNNDSYNFFSKTGGLVKTGPTGTNVMDLRVILIF